MTLEFAGTATTGFAEAEPPARPVRLVEDRPTIATLLEDGPFGGGPLGGLELVRRLRSFRRVLPVAVVTGRAIEAGDLRARRGPRDTGRRGETRCSRSLRLRRAALSGPRGVRRTARSNLADVLNLLGCLVAGASGCVALLIFAGQHRDRGGSRRRRPPRQLPSSRDHYRAGGVCRRDSTRARARRRRSD